MRKVLYILGQFEDDDVSWLARTGARRKIRAGDTLIYEGRRIEAIYILLTGHVTVHIQGLGLVAEMGPGEVMGEVSFLDSAPPSATVKAIEDCLVLEVALDDLRRKLGSDDGFGHRFYKALAIFLANRMRDRAKQFASGKPAGLSRDEVQDDELDEDLLDRVSLAGDRFDRLLKLLSQGGPAR